MDLKFVQSEAMFDIRARRLADGANLKITHSSYVLLMILVAFLSYTVYFGFVRQFGMKNVQQNLHQIV